MLSGRGRTPLSRRPQLLQALALCGTLLCACAFAQPPADAPPAAQAAPAISLPEYKGPAIAPAWLVLIAITAAAWVAIWSFINKDGVTTRGMKQPRWNTIVFLVGAAGLTLTFLAHGVFIIFTLLGLATTAAGYVVLRNRTVSEDATILTRTHLRVLKRRALARVGIRPKRPSATSVPAATHSAEGAGSAAYVGQETTIILKRKDGQALETIRTDPQAIQSPSEAMVAVKQIVESAVRARATDIHIEPTADALNIRFRVDGILHPLPPYPADLGPPIVSVIKVLSDMDIAERRRPQDGGFSGQFNEKDLDFRVASSGAMHGETMSIRILDRDRDLITLDKLGMSARVQTKFKESINAPHGMIIVSGPTGAGKTTTLYSALLEMDVYQKNIMTIEDPIEYSLENVQQLAVNLKAGITFAGALRSVLRQDPNVIMVGEIRDAETARVAMQAAMTGHLVLTTLHANDSMISLFRLLDLGVEPYLMSSSIACIVAQRLVRVLCECKVPYEPKPEFVAKLGLPADRPHYFHKAQGCPTCQNTGYFGRTGIFEMLLMTDPIRDLVRERASPKQIKAEARKNQMRTLQEDGLDRVLQGTTSLKELLRVTK